MSDVVLLKMINQYVFLFKTGNFRDYNSRKDILCMNDLKTIITTFSYGTISKHFQIPAILSFFSFIWHLKKEQYS